MKYLKINRSTLATALRWLSGIARLFVVLLLTLNSRE